jgi:hypothetical protein
MTRANIKSAPSLPQFKSRSKITEDFYTKAFIEKAAELGVVIHWIDVGTWQMPNGIILQNLRDAWDLARANASRSNEIEGSRKKIELDEILELINNTIVSTYEKASYGGLKLSDRDFDELIKRADKGAEVKIDRFLQQDTRPLSVGTKKSLGTARDMLQAFRREFLSAKEQIQKENKSALETQVDLARIDKAIHDIENIIFHTVKR